MKKATIIIKNLKQKNKKHTKNIDLLLIWSVFEKNTEKHAGYHLSEKDEPAKTHTLPDYLP